MTKARERAIKMYWEMAKEKCPFQTEEIVNGYLEGFIDCAELFEEEDKLTLTKYARIIIDKKDECIEGLEQENAELQDKLKNLASVAEVRLANWQKYEKENAELKEKFLTVKKDDVRKAKLNDCKTYEEKVEYLRQVTNYALFNDDISVMLWCFCQRGEIDTDQLTKAKEIIALGLRVCETSSIEYMNWYQKRAEQFLNGDGCPDVLCEDCTKEDCGVKKLGLIEK